MQGKKKHTYIVITIGEMIEDVASMKFQQGAVNKRN